MTPVPVLAAGVLKLSLLALGFLLAAAGLFLLLYRTPARREALRLATAEGRGLPLTMSWTQRLGLALMVGGVAVLILAAWGSF
jgi:hypothetical protein